MKRAMLYGLMLLIIAALIWLNYYLWLTQREKKQRIDGLQTQVGLHVEENQALTQRNEALIREVENLRSPDAYYAYEEKAREDYGMIGRNETYFILPDSELAGIPDVPGLSPEPPGIVNPPVTPLQKPRPEANPVHSAASPTNSEIIPVSPLPIQLESIK